MSRRISQSIGAVPIVVDVDDSSHGDWDDFSPQEEPASRRTLGAPEIVAAVLGVLIIIGLVVFWPSGTAKKEASAQFAVLGVPSEFHEAVVAETTLQRCPQLPDAECITVTFEINDGPDAGQSYRQDFTTDDIAPDFSVGDKVVLSRIPPTGTIVALTEAPCEFDAEATCFEADVRLASGPNGGEISTLILFPGQEEGLFVGRDVMVTLDFDATIIAISPATIEAMYRYADSQRRGFLLALALVFAAAVVALGRWRGVAALSGLGLSVVVVVLWLIPSLLDGNPPVTVAMIGAAAVAYLALYVSHGVNRTSTVALLGTLASLLLITMLSWITTILGEFTGLASEEATLLLTIEGFDIRGLLLAGIVIGAAGALDDVTVTQASAIAEIRSANPDIDVRHLFGRGMAIGRAHVGSIVNTLVLAYLGAALPLTILFVLAQQSFGDVVNSEVVAVEIVRSLVGTIGIVAAVPLTTWMATVWPSAHRHHA